MNHHAKAQQRKTHGPAPKPRRSVAAGRPRRPSVTSAAAAEGRLVRMVGRLAADAATASARAAHGYFVNGYLGALVAEGIVPEARVAAIRTACAELLDGNLHLQDLKAMHKSGNDTDPAYLRAVSLVRRAGHADEQHLAAQLGIGRADARQLIDRLQADGIVDTPDMFGTRRVLAPEVRS